MSALEDLRRLHRACATSGDSFTGTLLRHAVHRLHGRNVVAGRGVTIRHPQHLDMPGVRLRIGLDDTGFSDPADATLLNLRGTLRLRGHFAIGRGCRFDIGPGAVARFDGGYVNPCTRFVIMHGLSVGAGCAISWDCRIVDDDFHTIEWPGRAPRPRGAPIGIGARVWIGAGVSIFRGARIADGSVVAAGSVVRDCFDEPAVLLAGNPARIVRRGVAWG